MDQDSILKAKWPPSPGNTTVTESTFWPRVGSMLVVLAVVCLLIWGVLCLVGPLIRKVSGTSPAQEKILKIIERQAIGPGKALLVIKAGGKHFLLGLSESSISTLAELDLSSKPSEAVNETAPQAPTPSGDNSEQEDTDKPATPAPAAGKDLVKEVLNSHLSSLPFSNLTN